MLTRLTHNLLKLEHAELRR